MKPRFTILGLMVVVAVAAFVLAIWRMASEFWASVAFNLAAIALILASCNAKFSEGPVVALVVRVCAVRAGSPGAGAAGDGPGAIPVSGTVSPHHPGEGDHPPVAGPSGSRR